MDHEAYVGELGFIESFLVFTVGRRIIASRPLAIR